MNKEEKKALAEISKTIRESTETFGKAYRCATTDWCLDIDGRIEYKLELTRLKKIAHQLIDMCVEDEQETNS